MSEITKLYENANLTYLYCGDDYVAERMLEFECTDGDKEKCKTCDKVKTGHPPFTAEKQIELIKEIYPGYPLRYASGYYDNLFSFEEGLAYRINNSWEDLMEKQKQQIKEILK